MTNLEGIEQIFSVTQRNLTCKMFQKYIQQSILQSSITAQREGEREEEEEKERGRERKRKREREIRNKGKIS